MKKILLALALSLSALAANAEATFDEVQTLISQREYAAAASGLEVIIKNHPNSAKAFYAMAQAQAGLGNLEKAQLALTKATGLNPTLNFAPADSVASLKQAITPQAQKIEAIEPSHFWRNFFILLVLAAIGLIAYDRYRNRKRPDSDSGLNGIDPITPAPTPAPDTGFKVRALSDSTYTKTHSKSSTTSKTDFATSPSTRYGGSGGVPRATTYTPSYSAPSPTVPAAAQPTVVHHYNNSGSDMLTGVLVGSMLNSMNSPAPETRVVEREVIREVPAPSSWEDARPSYVPSVTESVRSSSWDDESSKPSSSWSSSGSSSSWDDESSKPSSSWSSSSSSSSWDSSSSSSSDSSSSSGSISSWD